MFEAKGKYNNAIIYSDRYDETAYSQLISFCNLKTFEGSRIRVMPDYHAGTGCVIGFTASGIENLIPNIVGVDIGCGVVAIKFANSSDQINLEKLDNFIRDYIPSGFNVSTKRNRDVSDMLKQLTCYQNLSEIQHLEKSLGSLGGGNHFIEVDVDKEGNKYLVVHTGSRNIGKQVATIHQKIAEHYQGGIKDIIQDKIKTIEPIYREQWLKEFKEANKVPKGLEHLTGQLLNNYKHDMLICQEFASMNRWEIINSILGYIGVETINHVDFKGRIYIESVHNYYDFQDHVIRKGAIAANENQPCIIPMNMKDGSLICIGKGNKEWNYSAPHGAGRLMSRSQAKESITLEEFQQSMQGIFTTSVNTGTIDESPMAYKPMDEIVKQIEDTVYITDILKPIYNFKASV